MKTFSLYVPKFNRTLTQSDVTSSICHLLKIPEHRLTYEAYREVRKHPKIQAMLDAQREEVFSWYRKQEKKVDNLVEYAIGRMNRDHDGYPSEEEIDALRAFASEVKNKILHVAWCSASGQKWREWRHHKTDMDEALTVIYNYRKSPEWRQPWTVYFTWEGDGKKYPRILAPVKRKPRRWNPDRRTPAAPKGETTAHNVHYFPGYENISSPDKK